MFYMQTCLGCGKPFTPTTASMYCPACSSYEIFYSNNTYVGLKEVKFCKYCGSSRIVTSNGYYKHYVCTECGSKFD